MERSRRWVCASALVMVCTGGLVGLAFSSGPSATPVKLVANDPDLNKLAWMTGSWVSNTGGQQSEEHWTHAEGGTMFAVSRTIAGGKTVFFEYLRIEKTGEGIIYFSSPKGRNPPTPFKATLIEERRAIFENPKHDFPQKITYWREADGTMRAKIEGPENSKQKAGEWIWQPATVVGG